MEVVPNELWEQLLSRKNDVLRRLIEIFIFQPAFRHVALGNSAIEGGRGREKAAIVYEDGLPWNEFAYFWPTFCCSGKIKKTTTAKVVVGSFQPTIDFKQVRDCSSLSAMLPAQWTDFWDKLDHSSIFHDVLIFVFFGSLELEVQEGRCNQSRKSEAC